MVDHASYTGRGARAVWLGKGMRADPLRPFLEVGKALVRPRALRVSVTSAFAGDLNHPSRRKNVVVRTPD